MKRSQRTIGLGVTLLLLLCACSKHEELAIKNAEGAIKKILTDPDSAEFTDERANDFMVCGNVNSKNAFGGYVGYRRFTVLLKDGAPEIEGQHRDIDRNMDKLVGELFDLTWKLCPPSKPD